ncbi:hemerythrin domain-containing protein [Streptacidiphilus carbonis]|uniref:hemerythrin domain-containing protein n=1 Tax=Streptacidiphilus carbonis TaxID=105422 RepID=UPI0005AA9716|nr:hemerythrin domain-containing protein [Streptacidiphilus carbonis]
MSTDQTFGPAHSDPDPDVITVLLGQHARVKNLFIRINSATGKAKQSLFDELRELLAAHETGEEIVLRPVSQKAAGDKVTDARNAEEKEANKVLTKLEKLDVDSAEFNAAFAEFEKSVLAHAQHEENEELPAVRAQCSEEERQQMGKRLLKAEKSAPTHPHASAAGSPTA